MDDRVARLEALVADLVDRVADLESRLARAEVFSPAIAHSSQHADTSLAPIAAASLQQWLALVGRTLVILGGAYLLRAITDSHTVVPQVGVALGLLYGAPWLLLASRAGRRGANVDAVCHALSTALIGYPLVWEATVRFHVLTPGQSAGLLAVLTGAALVLSSRRALQGLAWVVTFGALLSVLGLAAVTSAWVPFTLVAIGVGIATMWLGYLHGWVGMRWVAAAVANMMLFVATGRAAGDENTTFVIWLQALMIGGYLGSVKIRTIVRSHDLVPFEVAQSIGALAVGLGGLLYVLSGSAVGWQVVAIVCLLLAGGAYATAFGFSETQRPYASFFFQALVACFFTITGLMAGLGSARGSLGCAALAIVALMLARRHHRSTLALHAAAYALVGAIGSGLVAAATLAMKTPTASAIALPGITQVLALGALCAVAAMPVRNARDGWPYITPVVRCILAAFATWTADGVIVACVLSLVGTPLDAAQVSTIRTIVLVASAIALATAGRQPQGREASWLTYPLLTIAGLKLVLVDFMQGRPTTLFAALAVYGGGLILAPRILRRAGVRSQALPVLTSAHPQTTVR